MQYFEIFDLTAWTAPIFMAAYHQPLFCIIPLVLLGLIYQWSVTHFKDKLMLDGGTIQPKAETHRAADLSWLDRFGRTAIFLRNDIREGNSPAVGEHALALLLSLFKGCLLSSPLGAIDLAIEMRGADL